MKQYHQFTSEDFTQDASFIDWAKGVKGDSEFDWTSWITEHPEKQTAVEQAKSIILALSFEEISVSQHREDSIWSSISDQIKDDQPTTDDTSQTGVIRKSLIPVLSIAAVITVAVMIVLPSSGDMTTVNTSLAEVKTHILPDESEVVLNAESSIRYNKSEWDKTRTINLNGEAFFSVKKGATFSVQTDNGQVQVLGTSFNVYARNAILDVDCQTGKVSVKSSTDETILMPNQGVIINSNQHSEVLDLSSSQLRSTWQSGVYHYELTTLEDVFAELERQLDVELIIDESLAKTLFTGSFNVNKGIESIDEVLWPLGLNQSKNGKTITVSK